MEAEANGTPVDVRSKIEDQIIPLTPESVANAPELIGSFFRGVLMPDQGGCGGYSYYYVRDRDVLWLHHCGHTALMSLDQVPKDAFSYLRKGDEFILIVDGEYLVPPSTRETFGEMLSKFRDIIFPRVEPPVL